MHSRVIGLVVAIALYSGFAISFNAVILPAAGINGFAQLTGDSLGFNAPAASTSSTTAGSNQHESHAQSAGSARYFDLWLRPFGVHRPDEGDVWWALGSFAVLSTITTVLIFLFPKRVRYLSKVLQAEPVRNHLLNVLLGLLAYCVAYALLRLSWLTIAGVPFIPFLVGGVWLATMLGIVAVSFSLGRRLLRHAGLVVPALAETLLGLWLLFVTSMLPLVGWIAGGAAAAMGFGLVLQTRLGTRQRWSLDLLEEPPIAAEPPDDPKILPLRRAR